MAQDLQHAFPDQEEAEAIFVFARPYWVTFIPTALAYLIAFLFSIGVQYMLADQRIINPNTQNLLIVALGIFQLFAISVFFVAVLDFYYDIVIVTDRRLANLTQDQLFYRKFAQFNMEEVEDVNATVNGFLPTFLNYGEIQVQTAGTQENFIIPNLRYPNEIAAIISSLAEETKNNTDETDRLPDTEVIGVIEGQEITDTQTLAELGAMLPTDLRLHHGP